MKLVVDSVAAGLAAADRAQAFQEVVFFIALSGALALLENACSSLAGLLSAAQAQLVTERTFDVLHSKSVELDLEYYENSKYYDTLHRAQQEAPYRPTRILHSILELGQSAIFLIALTVLLLSFHWSLPVLLVAAAVPGLLVRVRFAGKLFSWQRQKTATERKAAYFNWMLTADAHAKEIRLFNLGTVFTDRFRRLRTQLRRERLDLATKRSVAELITQSGATIAAFGLYGFLALRTVYGSITLGDLVMFYQAVQRGQAYIRQFLGSISQLYEDNLFLSSFYEFLSLKPKVTEPLCPKPIRRPMRAVFAFDHVSFQYPASTRKALDDINLTILPGEHIALVGENGAGKTTLIKLLCRLYDPTGGAITLGGVDLREFSIQELRREISVVLQDYARYHLTARENIWLGNVEMAADAERIVTAARQAGADGVISSLRSGYDTVLGKWFEDGDELSIGEWQKVALARAFFRDAQIIVLDEPTSAIDAEAEYQIFKRFHKLAKGRTALLISHRLSTVRMADRIYVIEDGRIIESGTHEDLVFRGGRYARLFEMQAQNYR
jgi:ATP-binding cassette subfamily B protein